MKETEIHWDQAQEEARINEQKKKEWEAELEENRKLAKEYFFNNKFDKAIHPLTWLIEKFTPVPGWKQEDINKLK